MEELDTVDHLACRPKRSGAYLGMAHSFAGAYLRDQVGAQEALVDEEWAPAPLLDFVAPEPSHQKESSSV